MLYLTTILLNRYSPTYRIRGLKYVDNFVKTNLFTFSEIKKPYRNLISIAVINYTNVYDHLNWEKTSAFTHYFASTRYIYSNVKTTLLK